MLPEGTKLGFLRLGEVFIEYDGPQLFACDDEQGRHLLAVHAPATSRGDNWLYIYISLDRLRQVKGGLLTLRYVFSRPEQGFVERVVFTPSGATEVMPVEPAALPRDWFPARGERLGEEDALEQVTNLERFSATANYVDLEDLPPFLLSPTPMWEMSPRVVTYLKSKRTRVADAAARSGRSVIDLVFKTPLDRSEMPAGILGNLLVCAQSAVDALTLPPSFGSRKLSHREAGRLDVLPFFAGSFGLRMDTHQAGLLPDPVVQTALERLTKLLAAASSVTEMRQLLAEVGPKAAFKFRKLAIALEKSASDFSIEVGVPNEAESTAVELSYRDLASLVEFLKEAAAESQEILLFRGNLIGVSLRTKFFALEDLERTISGRIADEFLPSMRGKTIGNDYMSTLSVISEINDATGQERVRHVLTNLQTI